MPTQSSCDRYPYNYNEGIYNGGEEHSKANSI